MNILKILLCSALITSSLAQTGGRVGAGTGSGNVGRSPASISAINFDVIFDSRIDQEQRAALLKEMVESGKVQEVIEQLDTKLIEKRVDCLSITNENIELKKQLEQYRTPSSTPSSTTKVIEQ